MALNSREDIIDLYVPTLQHTLCYRRSAFTLDLILEIDIENIQDVT